MGYMIKTKNGELYHSELYHFGVPGMKWAQEKLKYGRQLTREEYNKLYAKAHAHANGLRANMRGIKRTAQLKGYGQLGAAKALASPYAKRAVAAGKKYGTMVVGAAKSGYNQARGAAEGYLAKRRATKNAAAANERGKKYTSEMQRRKMESAYKKTQNELAKQHEYERMTRNGKVAAAQLKAERHRARIEADPFLKRKEEGAQAARRAAAEARRKQEFLEGKTQRSHEAFIKGKNKRTQEARAAAAEARRKQEFLNNKRNKTQDWRRANSEDARKKEFLERKNAGSRRAAAELARKQEFLENKRNKTQDWRRAAAEARRKKEFLDNKRKKTNRARKLANIRKNFYYTE